MARPTSVEQFARRSQMLWRKPCRQTQRFAAELTFSGQNGIRGLLDMMSDNPGNDRQADQLDSQLQATDSQRHTPSFADKVANLRLSSLDDILELQPSAEPSIFQLKYARASLAKWMHPSPDSGPSDTPLDFDQRPGRRTRTLPQSYINWFKTVRPVRNRYITRPIQSTYPSWTVRYRPVNWISMPLN